VIEPQAHEEQTVYNGIEETGDPAPALFGFLFFRALFGVGTRADVGILS
jgi:hypothetical protein